MKQNWIPTLLFSLAFGLIGFILGRITCCPPLLKNGKECCSTAKCSSTANDTKVIIQSLDEDAEIIEEIMLEFENSDFEGDTLITIPGGTVQISKSNDGEMNVSVSMEKEVETEEN